MYFSLRSLDFNFASPAYAHTYKQTPVTTTIITTYRALRHDVIDWSSESFKSLKSRLHKDAVIRRPKRRDYSDTWTIIHSSTKHRKTRDLCFLIVHEALPIADILLRRGLRIDNKCGLCDAQRETIEHLFISCPSSMSWSKLLSLEWTGLMAELLGRRRSSTMKEG